MATLALPPAGTWRRPSVIPGFGLALGLTLAYLGLVVLIPLGGLFLTTARMGWADLIGVLADERTIAALRLSFGASLAAALANVVMGTLVAWALVRYDFPGRRLLDAMGRSIQRGYARTNGEVLQLTAGPDAQLAVCDRSPARFAAEVDGVSVIIDGTVFNRKQLGRRTNDAYLVADLYRAHGFRPVGIRPNYYVEENEDAIVMLLELKPGS